MKNLIESINFKIDMLAYRFFYKRWTKRFIQNPYEVIPFKMQIDHWASKQMTPEEIEKCKDDFKNILGKRK